MPVLECTHGLLSLAYQCNGASLQPLSCYFHYLEAMPVLECTHGLPWPAGDHGLPRPAGGSAGGEDPPSRATPSGGGAAGIRPEGPRARAGAEPKQ